MTECNSHEIHYMYPNLNSAPLHAITLNDQQQFRLNKINEIKDYFIAETKKRKLMSKRFSQCIAYLDYFDKALTILLSVTTGSISIASFVTVIGAPVGIVSACFSLAFSSFTGIVKKLLKTTRNKKKKHNKIVMLTRGKLNIIESKIYEALISSEISHEYFVTIINEEKNIKN